VSIGLFDEDGGRFLALLNDEEQHSPTLRERLVASGDSDK